MTNEKLPPEVFEAVVRALADALVAQYRARHSEDSSSGMARRPSAQSAQPSSPWLTVKEAALHARCSVGTLSREVRAGRLRSVRVGGRRSLRFRSDWIDAWLERRGSSG